MAQIATYLVKIKPLGLTDVQQKVINAFKEQEWVTAVEKMNNPMCFYIEATSSEMLEQMLSDIKIGFLKKKIAEVLYSKIDKVYTNSRKEIRNVRRVQG